MVYHFFLKNLFIYLFCKGAVATAARTILQSNASVPQMLVVSDLEDVFLPQPDDLLVNLTESRAVVESLLRSLGDMFKDTQTVGNALGSALLAGFKLIVCIDNFSCLFFAG